MRIPTPIASASGSVTTDPSGPLRQGRYRSPLRDERLAAWLGIALAGLFAVCFVTGAYSHLHQHPVDWLPVPPRPAGLYRVTQGLHVAAGIASLPVLLAKLWVVWPRLVAWPPFRQVADVVERAGLVVLVAGGVFMVFSGVANIAQWYPWRFSFTASHYWVAWATVGATVAHAGAKWALTGDALRRRRAGPAPGEPAAPGMSRRGFLGTVAAASGVLTAVTAGQAFPPLRRLALLAPRDPADRPINRSAANAGVVAAAGSPGYRLAVDGNVARPLTLSLPELSALATRDAGLPIACVEGWSWSGRWRGVPLRDLLELAGAPAGAQVRVESMEREGAWRSSFVNRAQARDPDTLLATHLDGEVLSLDHGYPLRLIGPGRPGVNQTKWVHRLVVL